jgi:hypothetical protein
VLHEAKWACAGVLAHNMTGHGCHGEGTRGRIATEAGLVAAVAA